MIAIEYLADRPEFIPALATWLHAEFGTFRPGTTVLNRVACLKEACGREKMPIIFVAADGEQPLGSASLVPQDLETRPELTPWLASVVVGPEHRRRGIGAMLVNRVVQEARFLGFSRLFLYTPGPGTLYHALGWSVRERSFISSPEGELPIKIMEMNLSAPSSLSQPRPCGQ